MLTRDVIFEGFSATDWVRLADVFRARSNGATLNEFVSDTGSGSAWVAPQGGVIAVTAGSRLRKLISTREGRLDATSEPWPSSLELLATRHEAAWAVELSVGALEDLFDRFGARLRREQEYLAQALELLAAARELEQEGRIRFWPRKLYDWPVPSERVVLRALDLLCPSERAVVLGVFDRGDLYTCLAAERRGPGFSRFVGPCDLKPEMGLLSGDFRRDYRHLLRAVEATVAPVALGCFGELETFQTLAQNPEPGAWASAVAARDIVLSPVTPGIALPLGIDVGRAALVTMKSLASRFGATGLFGVVGPLAPALERAQAFLENDAKNYLGFNPWALISGFIKAASKTSEPTRTREQ